MLNDFLREEKEKETTSDTTSFLDEIEEKPQPSPMLEMPDEPETGFLGMTPGQRLVIAIMFFFMVVIIGLFFLLVTGSIAIPI